MPKSLTNYTEPMMRRENLASHLNHQRSKAIKITAEMIERAQKGDSSHCMVAEALREQLGAKFVTVDLQAIRYTLPEKGLRYLHLTAPSAQEAIVAFDDGKKVKPFSFRLGVPAWVTEAGQKTERKTKKNIRRKRRLVNVAGNPVVVGGRHRIRVGRRRMHGLKQYGTAETAHLNA